MHVAHRLDVGQDQAVEGAIRLVPVCRPPCRGTCRAFRRRLRAHVRRRSCRRACGRARARRAPRPRLAACGPHAPDGEAARYTSSSSGVVPTMRRPCTLSPTRSVQRANHRIGCGLMRPSPRPVRADRLRAGRSTHEIEGRTLRPDDKIDPAIGLARGARQRVEAHQGREHGGDAEGADHADSSACPQRRRR